MNTNKREQTQPTILLFIKAITRIPNNSKTNKTY